MASLDFADSLIRTRVSAGRSYEEIATELQQMATVSGQGMTMRGLSSRRVRRYYCGICRSSHLSQSELDHHIVKEHSMGCYDQRGLLLVNKESGCP